MIELLGSIFPTLSAFVFAGLIFFVAEIVYVAFGFGAGLLCVGTLAVFMPVMQDVVVVMVLVNLPIELFVVYSSKKVLQWRGLFRILVGIGAGVLAGTWLLTVGPPVVLLLVLGLFLVISGVFFALFPRLEPVSIPVWIEPLVGGLSGILAGLFGTGGPPLIYYFQLKGSEKSVFRGSLMALFLFMSVIKLPMYWSAGLITGPRLVVGAILLPVVVLGALVGNMVHLQIEENTFRRFVGGILAIIGFVLLFR